MKIGLENGSTIESISTTSKPIRGRRATIKPVLDYDKIELQDIMNEMFPEFLNSDDMINSSYKNTTE